ncbi:MAG: VWA domain-containing protein [Candidatus Methanomethylophilaceae archaeon]|nr:VWA domain-containing protein [Candidatus Methanomethylophilaceae archaeon]
MKKAILTTLLALSAVCFPLGAQPGFDALRADYPLLMQKFGAELGEQRADYIFAIDVSGTMDKYRDTVVPALGAFFRSLQDGDYVSIIKFGGEASNEVGSAGKIGGGTVSNLIESAGRIYNKPTTSYEKEKYYNWTDLDNMLHYLADDMQQIGRNRLKFVFIITDFVHDPSPSRRGREDWDGAARRFATEQSGNDVYVFALQLPGGGRDLEKVRNVFPREFKFSHVPVPNGQALSQWFTQRKNAILLDKFISVVSGHIRPAELTFSPEMDFSGRLGLALDWTPNPVYDCLRLDDITLSGARGLRMDAELPVTVMDDAATVPVGALSKEDASVLKPSLRHLDGELTLRASFAVPYEDELRHLGFEAPSLTATAPVTRTVFFYPLPFWLFCTIIGLILLYIILVIRAFARNASAASRINGRFEVTEDGAPVTERKKANGVNSVDIGRAAAFLPVPDCRWSISISVRRYNPFLLFFKSPEYVIEQTRGNGFRANGVKWGSHQKPKIAPYSKILVGTHVIRWIQ